VSYSQLSAGPLPAEPLKSSLNTVDQPDGGAGTSAGAIADPCAAPAARPACAAPAGAAEWAAAACAAGATVANGTKITMATALASASGR
jgi:hypothetical protein